jgi:chromosome segregation ATPase
MNILHLEIDNLKRITAIEINPTTGQPIILTGDNGQGKSSVLDGIILALSNTGLDDPIKHGRPSASVRLTLGADKAEYLLERKVTKKGDSLTLTDAAGVAVQKPQTFLNGLLGNYAFDPLEFVRLKPKDQVEALKIAAGLDFTAIDAKRAGLYSERTATAKEGKEIAAQLAAVPTPSEGTPTEEVSASDLMQTLTTLENAAREVTDQERTVAEVAYRFKSRERRMEQLLAEIEVAKMELQDAEKDGLAASNEYERLSKLAPTEHDISSARDAIATVDETNRRIRSARKHQELSEKRTKLLSDHGKLSRRIEEIDEEKSLAIQNANLPLDGLELTDDGVMVSGTFFSQLSTAEQIRVSTLVAMSQNPKLKIIFIREGALMNAANIAAVASLAAERGVQVWIEKFQEQPSSSGLHIVDGAIAFVDGKEVAE